MNQYKILTKIEKEKIRQTLKEQFGITKIPGVLIQRGKEKIFFFNGNLSIEDTAIFCKEFNVEGMGVYFAKEQNNEIRLSLEGTQILKDQITKNIFELNKEQLENWMHGRELNIETGKKGFLVMKYQDDFIGCGKASALKISNFIPKSRRLKNKN